MTYLVSEVLLELCIPTKQPNYPSVTGHKGTCVRGEAKVEGDSGLNQWWFKYLTFANIPPQFLTLWTCFSSFPRALEGIQIKKVPEFKFCYRQCNPASTPIFGGFINCNFLAHLLHHSNGNQQRQIFIYLFFLAAWRPVKSEFHYLLAW